MFPFTLTGPQFLVFYLAQGMAVLWAVWTARRRQESTETISVTLDDPYLIACLRGGPQEILRVASVSLVDRGLVEVRSDGTLQAGGDDAEGRVRRPIEQQILRFLRTPAAPLTALTDPSLMQAAGEIEARLVHLGLLPDEQVRRARLGRMLLALAVLETIAFFRILQALSRGRHNLGFLIAMALVFSGLVAAFSFARRTVRGDRTLAELKSLFTPLKHRANATVRPGGATADAVFLAAVFGIAALPVAGFAFARQMYPRASASTTSSSACGSSCSSASSCSSGGSCGGGCGGCGGCGG